MMTAVKRLSVPDAAAAFVAWLRAWDLDAKHTNGHHYTADELEAYFDWYLADEDVVGVPFDLVKRAMLKVPAVHRERKHMVHNGRKARKAYYFIPPISITVLERGKVRKRAPARAGGVAAERLAA